MQNFRNRSVQSHDFAMTPRSDIPRSRFRMQHVHKTAFDAGYLVPAYCEEVLPGDVFTVRMTGLTRLATPIFPTMDNLHFESFFFFVPHRLVWNNFPKMMGERENPSDSISYTVPQQVSPNPGYAVGSLQDYFGLPAVGQGTYGYSHSALPLRGYNLIYNTWFRDENIQDSLVVDKDDGPDTVTDYVLRRRGKRYDYFTQCLPHPQKGGTAVSVPIGGSAPIKGLGIAAPGTGTGTGSEQFRESDLSSPVYNSWLLDNTAGSDLTIKLKVSGGNNYPDVYADLTQATGNTINALRLAFMTQELLEKDARGGTRYTEHNYIHFGVRSPDSRLQRPEYLGGGSTPIMINPVAQTSVTASTPLGSLAGFGIGVANHGFSQSFVEHGYVIGLVNVRADLLYQQGIRRHWSRLTRYDFYYPTFAGLGEQAVYNREIFSSANANDALVFGYCPRWDEYRYHPSYTSGLMRSTAAAAIDQWHFGQEFSSLPGLNSSFIEDTPPLARVLAVGGSANGQQLLCDMFFDVTAVRPMPMFGIPGQTSRF